MNDKPHLGHALEKIQADVLARYHRLKGDEVFFLTGTDEHGAKIVRAAQKAGKDPQEFVNDISEKFQFLKDALNLSYDDFIRTSDKERHWPGAEKMWKALREAGALYEKNYKGLYCVGHEAFITEKELVDGKCPDHGKEPEMVEEKNWFFKLSKYAKEIAEKIKSGELQIIPEGRRNEILSFLEGEVNDVSFSRSIKNLEWGIPVPDDPEQVMYVWCDALTSYISALGYGRNEDYKKWWPADVQVLGKDILRFHAAIWPAMLMAAKLPLPKQLFVHGFITVDGKKMSKTIGNVVDPVEFIEKLVEKGVPRESAIDAFRYYLLREIPSTEDGDFSEEKFIERYNADLANGLGNLVSRILQMASQYLDKSIDVPNQKNIFDISLGGVVRKRLDAFELDRAMFALWSWIKDSDRLIDEQKPFEAIKTNKQAAEKQLVYLLTDLAKIALVLRPFMPHTSEKIINAIVENKKPENLFPRIS